MSGPSGRPSPVLPRGRMPTIGVRELLAAMHRRRERRRESVGALADAVASLRSQVERHLARIAELKQAVEAQGGDMAALQHYDNFMARIRAELRAAEKSLADAFHEAGSKV